MGRNVIKLHSLSSRRVDIQVRPIKVDPTFSEFFVCSP